MKPSLHHSHSTRDGSGHHNCLSASQREPRNPFFFLQRLFFKGSSVRGPWIQVMVTQLPSVAPESLNLSGLLWWGCWLFLAPPHKALALLLGPLFLILPLIRPHSHMKRGMQLPQKGVLWGGGGGAVSGCCHLPLQHPLQSDWRSWWRWGNRLPFLISSEKRLGVWFKETS